MDLPGHTFKVYNCELCRNNMKQCYRKTNNKEMQSDITLEYLRIGLVGTNADYVFSKHAFSGKN